MADELANDFLHVRISFQKLNHKLRENLVESEGSRGDVLDSLFASVNVIAESEPGRPFKVIYRLLTDRNKDWNLKLSWI